MTDINELRKGLAATIKTVISDHQAEVVRHEAALRAVRAQELRKSDKEALACIICDDEGPCRCLEPMAKAESKVCTGCSQLNCSCKGKLPGDKKSKDLGGEEGSGGTKAKAKALFKKAFEKAAKGLDKCGDMKPVEKADAPMAKPPGTSPTAPHPTSKPGSPSVGGPPAPMAKAAFLGGKDPMSQQMTGHAMASAPKPTAVLPGMGGPKLTPEDHARRAAGLAEFTPAGAFTPTAPAGSVAGPMKPGAPPVSGLQLAGPGAKPQGAPAPQADPLARFKPKGTSAA